MTARIKGVHTVTKHLANGSAQVYRYAWRGGPRLFSEPGSEAFVAEYQAANAQPRDERLFEGEFRDAPFWLLDLAKSAEKRARRKGIEYTLTGEDLRKLATRAKSRCEVTGHPFRYRNPCEYRIRPFAPSLDRIDARAGYVPGNVRLVLYLVNVAMQDWGEAPLTELLAYMSANAKKRLRT